MTFTEELTEILDSESISPDDKDWITSFINDVNERERLKALFYMIVSKQLDNIKQELATMDPGEVPEGFTPLVAAGDVTLASLVAIARVAGIVSERQRNTALAEQLGDPYGGRDPGRL